MTLASAFFLAVGHGESDLHPYAAQNPTLTYALTRRTGVRTPIFVRTTKQEFLEFFVRTLICSNCESFENRGSTVFILPALNSNIIKSND